MNALEDGPDQHHDMADPYLAGFLDGLAAAQANQTVTTPSENRNSPSAKPRTSRTQFPHFVDDTNFDGSSITFTDFSSCAQSLPGAVLDRELHRASNIRPDAASTSTGNPPPDWSQSLLTAYSLDEHAYEQPRGSGATEWSTRLPSSAIVDGLAQHGTPQDWFLPSPAASRNASETVCATNSLIPWNELCAHVDPREGVVDQNSALQNSSREGVASINLPDIEASPLVPIRGAQHPNAWPNRRAASQAGKGNMQIVFRAHGSKRAKFDEQSRVRTALTRAIGACEACRKKKLRCDQSSKEKFVPCGRCAKLPPRLLSSPCCRVELLDLKLFRLGTTSSPGFLQSWMLSKDNSKCTIVLKDGTIAFEPPRRVYVTQDINLSSFPVTISRYQPGPEDATAYIWTDKTGKTRAYDLPPYYITDMAEATESMAQFFQKARREWTKYLLANSNPIVQKTVEEAERYCDTSNSELVSTALMIWSATRMIERSWLICGDDLLGLPPMEYDIGPYRCNPCLPSVPVTPIMDTQLDELTINGLLKPLSTKLLRLLKAKVLAKRKEDWFEIYLASFITLLNAEHVLEHVVDFARRYGLSAEPKTNDEASLSHAYYHACKTILAYFHFASGGAAPLSIDWNGSDQDTSMMSQDQIAYLREVQGELMRQGERIKALKGETMYQTEMYWCHQMLLPGWQAQMPHAGRFLEYTEKDFLLS